MSRDVLMDLLAQYSDVKLIADYSCDGLDLPRGAEGTIVDVLPKHRAYIVEFHPPHCCVEALGVDLVAPDAA